MLKVAVHRMDGPNTPEHLMAQGHGTKISAAAQIIWGTLAALVGAAALWMAAVTIQAYGDSDDRATPLLVISIVLAFTAAVFGFASVISAIERKKRQAVASRRALHPDEPWLWSDEWRHGRIKALPGRAATAILIVFALFWNSVVIGAAIAIQHQASTPIGAWILLAVFGATGLFLIGLAVYVAVLVKKFDRGVFQMSSVPGIIGGSLAGTVQLPRQLPAGVEVSLELACERISGSGKSSTTTCLFQNAVRLRASAGVLPVSFQIPPDLPPSDSPDHRSSTRTKWWLKTKASVPGVDYSDVFEVPVFQISKYHSLAEGIVDASEPVSPPRKTTCRIVESGSARTVVALQGVRYWGCGLVTALIFPLIALPAGFAFEGGSRLGIHLAGTILGVATLALLCTSFLTVPARIEIDRSALRIYHGKGPLHRTRTVPLWDIAHFKYVSSGDPPSQRIDVYTRNGQSCEVAEDLSGSEETKWLTIELTRAVDRHRS